MDWDSRFLQQANWTKDLRAYLFEHTGIKKARRVLEVGCGTGAILSGLSTPAAVHGLDMDYGRLLKSHRQVPSAELACGNALSLPYSSGIFDITFCHFLLLWVRQPVLALSEMKRVTRPGGAVLVLAEPDYNARIDKPAALAPLGRMQTESLKRQGADPGVGKRLAELFRGAGMIPVETGPLGVDFHSENGLQRREIIQTSTDRVLEWAVLEADLTGLVPANELRRMELVDRQAWSRGERVLHVPTYFAWGIV